ncbi:MAG: ABC transporter ATP-binding protein [Gammaproteobacteria bacterium]|nr:ABC transporter ATP-binding protein [Gammaproteobacteria bacterium]
MSIDLAKTQLVSERKAIPKKLGPFIWLFMREHKLALLIFLIMSVVDAAEVSLSPYFIKMIIDGAIKTVGDMERLIPTVLLPAILYASMPMVLNIFFRVYEYAYLKTMPIIKSDITATMFRYLSQHSYSYFQERFSGNLAKKIFDLMSGVESIIQIIHYIFTTRFIIVLIGSAILFTVQPIFGIILAVWAFCFVGASYYMAKKSEALSYEFSEADNVVGGKIVDSITNILSAKLFSNFNHEEKLISKSLKDVVAKDQLLQWHMMKTYFMQGTLITILSASMISGLLYGRLNNWVTIGDFALILALSSTVAMNIFNTGKEMIRFSKEVGKCRQALNIIVEPQEISDNTNATELNVPEGKILFDNVQFQYKDAEPLFENKSVIIEPGQKVGLVGHSGSGKSTFVNLILRLHDVTHGRILIDGQDIRNVTQESLRKNIGMIPQDPSLFHRTLMENIHFGKIDASTEEIINASKSAHAHDFIVTLPKGYDSMVGERGVKLSGGQRQRIAIARAFLKNAPILILDEATSQLDSITEKYIQESLWELMQNKTTIVIAHRLSTLLHMDRILVFDKGKIVEDGTHQELLAKKGLYSELWKSQVGGFLLDRDDGILI